MMKNRSVNILGHKWKIKYKELCEDINLDGNDGYCDESTKKIVICKLQKEKYSCEDLENIMRKVLRHEIIHAYMYECGLCECIPRQSGQSELYIDWFARKYPDIHKTFKELGVLE